MAFAPSSLILANNFLPVNRALCTTTISRMKVNLIKHPFLNLSARSCVFRRQHLVFFPEQYAAQNSDLVCCGGELLAGSVRILSRFSG
ncbi:hypothetical protein DXX92_10300 [Thalassotalea euphylliae]|uniref:Uncharacterized protein n=1 Tax=Thalassotalea euphylliae TaxID=1655234 RepID=A0A3E0UFD0_9GAMM|nr:hypothetical protein DXX92_10300 [Thalassotalea euphylliae]